METEHVIVKRLDIINHLTIYDTNIDKDYFSNIDKKINQLELQFKELEININQQSIISKHNACEAIGEKTTIEGVNTKTIGSFSHSEGNSNYSYGDHSHTEGTNNKSYGEASHVEGISNIAKGKSSHIEGICNLANGDFSHVEGESNISYGIGSHSQGSNTKAIGNYSHSSGIQTIANGDCCYVGGINSQSLGNNSFSHGFETLSNNINSVSFGDNTITSNNNEFVCGQYNTSIDNRIFSVGIGNNDNNRKDAINIYLNGIVEIDTLVINGNLIHKNTNSLDNYPIFIDNNLSINTHIMDDYYDLQELLEMEIIHLNNHLLKIKPTSNIEHMIIKKNNMEYISMEQLCLKCIRGIQQLYHIIKN